MNSLRTLSILGVVAAFALVMVSARTDFSEKECQKKEPTKDEFDNGKGEICTCKKILLIGTNYADCKDKPTTARSSTTTTQTTKATTASTKISTTATTASTTSTTSSTTSTDEPESTVPPYPVDFSM